jgi:glucosyl-3-phosphoglycerate synthase
VHPEAARWFAKRTSSANDWPSDRLVEMKGSARVSVILPALDEEPTVGDIVVGLRGLAERTGLIDEILVIDSGSADQTAKVAAEAGATVYHRGDIRPELGSFPGKGEVLWKAQYVATGDIFVYVDSDLTDFGEHYVLGLLGPLFADASVHMVKAFYDRPLLDVAATGGGRVTELMARPLLNALKPELAGVVQPLAGEYAARRSLLEALPFAAGYGVETGLLLDTVKAYGLDAVAQVDLGQRTHGHQDTAALGRMAATILHTVLRRLAPEQPLWPDLTQFHRIDGTPTPLHTPIPRPDRPPKRSVDLGLIGTSRDRLVPVSPSSTTLGDYVFAEEAVEG